MKLLNQIILAMNVLVKPGGDGYDGFMTQTGSILSKALLLGKKLHRWHEDSQKRSLMQPGRLL